MISYFVKMFGGELKWLSNKGTEAIPIYDGIERVFKPDQSIEMIAQMIVNSYMIKGGIDKSMVGPGGNFVEIYRVGNECFGLFLPKLNGRVEGSIVKKVSDWVIFIKDNDSFSATDLFNIGNHEINRLPPE